MKIAVTYADEQIFQHFGHTEEFKVYDYEVQMDSDEAYLFKLVEDNALTVIFACLYT